MLPPPSMDEPVRPTDLAAQVRERYEREAVSYRELWAPVLLAPASDLIRALAPRPCRRVLDLATGVGTLLPVLERSFPGALVGGLDLSAGMLELAPAGTQRAVMDATRLGVAGQSVDLALLVFVLFHLADPVAGLREARRVLNPGGQVAALTWGAEMESPAHRVWNECLDEYGAVPGTPGSVARHDLVDEPAKMERLLAGAGFSNVRAWTGEVSFEFDLDHLVRLKTELGSAKNRFESVDASVRNSFLVAVRARLQRLTRPDLVARGQVIHAIATA